MSVGEIKRAVFSEELRTQESVRLAGKEYDGTDGEEGRQLQQPRRGPDMARSRLTEAEPGVPNRLERFGSMV
jgi:hypothetical protein